MQVSEAARALRALEARRRGLGRCESGDKEWIAIDGFVARGRAECATRSDLGDCWRWVTGGGVSSRRFAFDAGRRPMVRSYGPF